jgi:hypothetical protein
MTRAVILQPMYLPWIGYFGMMDTADVFVFYDDVQFVRRSWQRRNKIKIPDGDFTWLTVSVHKDFGQEIREVELCDDGWRAEHWQALLHSYSNAPYFEHYRDELEGILKMEWEYLVDVNMELIRFLYRVFDLSETKFHYSSAIDVEGTKTNRLIEILLTIEADEYVTGPAAQDYLEKAQFEAAGIELFWHEFEHPEYEQIHGEFVSHLSAIDLLFHQGSSAGETIKEAEEGALVSA